MVKCLVLTIYFNNKYLKAYVKQLWSSVWIGEVLGKKKKAV